MCYSGLKNVLRLTSYIFFLIGVGGCRTYNPKYGHVGYANAQAKKNIESMLDSLHGKGKMTIPYAEATFCLERAVENVRKANINQINNDLMLGAAALTGATGLGLSAAVVVKEELDGVAVAAAITSVLPGAILGAREAFKTYEVAKARRIAAARDVDAAIMILKKYALADDPKEIQDDGFSICRDGDIDIANSYSGSVSVSSGNLTASSSLEKAKLDQQVAEEKAQTKIAAAKEADKTAAVAVAENDLAQKKLKDAEATASAAKTEVAKTAANEAKTDAETEADAAKDKAKKATDAAKKAQTDADDATKIAELKKEIADAMAEVISSYAQLRRSLLFLSSQEVQVTTALASEAKQRLDAARLALKNEIAKQSERDKSGKEESQTEENAQQQAEATPSQAPSPKPQTQENTKPTKKEE